MDLPLAARAGRDSGTTLADSAEVCPSSGPKPHVGCFFTRKELEGDKAAGTISVANMKHLNWPRPAEVSRTR